MKFIDFALVVFFASLLTLPGLAFAQTNEPVDDFFNTIENQNLAIEEQDLLANDQVSPFALFRITKPPLYGTLQTTGTGFLYVPPADSIEGLGGMDSFVYGLSSGPYEEVTAKVTVRVAPGQVPLSGRWIDPWSDCQNDETFDHLGWYDSATAEISLCRLSGASIEYCVDFVLPGGPGLTPLIGDWDGDGCDEPGTYDSTSAEFILYQFLDSECTLPDGECILTEFSTFNWGEQGSSALVGDWNGDGIDTVGLRHPRSSTFFTLLDENSSESAMEVIEVPTVFEPFPIVFPWTSGDRIGVFDATSRSVVTQGCEQLSDPCLQLPPANGPGSQPLQMTSTELPFTGHWNFGRPIGTAIGIFDPSAESETILYARTTSRPPELLTIPIDTSGR